MPVFRTSTEAATGPDGASSTVRSSSDPVLAAAERLSPRRPLPPATAAAPANAGRRRGHRSRATSGVRSAPASWRPRARPLRARAASSAAGGEIGGIASRTATDELLRRRGCRRRSSEIPLVEVAGEGAERVHRAVLTVPSGMPSRSAICAWVRSSRRRQLEHLAMGRAQLRKRLAHRQSQEQMLEGLVARRPLRPPAPRARAGRRPAAAPEVDRRSAREREDERSHRGARRGRSGAPSARDGRTSPGRGLPRARRRGGDGLRGRRSDRRRSSTEPREPPRVPSARKRARGADRAPRAPGAGVQRFRRRRRCRVFARRVAIGSRGGPGTSTRARPTYPWRRDASVLDRRETGDRRRSRGCDRAGRICPVKTSTWYSRAPFRPSGVPAT